MCLRTCCSRILIILALLTSVPAVAAGNAGAQPVRVAETSTATATVATRIKQVSPLTAEGRLRNRYTVTSHGRGYCWTTSFMNGQLYRCFKGNSILDPCWKETGRHSVVCLGRPWSTHVTRLRLTKPLPAQDPYGPGTWGLRLGGGVGVNCMITTGAGGMAGGRPISYYCARGWVLLGNGPNQSKPLWTMLTAKWVDDHYAMRGRKPVPVAWKPVV